MNVIFDVGMYDGSDTKYYLSEGYNVIAIEANPNLVERARSLFSQEISSGQLKIINAALCDISGQKITLTISGDDLGSSSIFEDKITNKSPLGSYNVDTVTLTELIEAHGRPHFIKIDIEGADRYCILPLNNNNRPKYISFEAGVDTEELIHHLSQAGFTRFKAINQCNFYELTNQKSLVLRVKRKIIHLLGYKQPKYVMRNGRL